MSLLSLAIVRSGIVFAGAIDFLGTSCSQLGEERGKIDRVDQTFSAELSNFQIAAINEFVKSCAADRKETDCLLHRVRHFEQTERPRVVERLDAALRVIVFSHCHRFAHDGPYYPHVRRGLVVHSKPFFGLNAPPQSNLLF
jgi:hypothetical protein